MCLLGDIVEGVIDLFGDVRNFFTGIVSDTLAFDVAKDSWGGWGLIGAVVGNGPIAVPVPWHTALNAKSASGSGLAAGLTQLVQELTGFTTFGLKIITDEDDQHSGIISDPVPELPGDILGYAIYLDTSDTYAAGVIGGFKVNFKRE